ncbi:DUF551 domain-containing protein [Enterobacter hormaechei]|uniref:DUF551 domain-containing protein n=1 Tax=Enterobacter hormaechei TaxID=158836 RepID=UPI003A4D39E5
MDNRYEIAEQNGMSREFADWFFENKKAGCGNVWFMMMAAMWEGWKGRAAMLQGAEPVTTANKLQDGWIPCSERMPEDDDFVYIWPRPDFGVELHVAQYGKFDKRDTGWYAQVYEQNYGIEYYPVRVTHWMPLPAAPQQEVK